MSYGKVFGRMMLHGAGYTTAGAIYGAIGAQVLSDAGYAGYSVTHATRSGAAGNVLVGAAVSLLKDIYVSCCGEGADAEHEFNFYKFVGEMIVSVSLITAGGVLGHAMLNQTTEMSIGQVAAAMAVGSTTMSAAILGFACLCCICCISLASASSSDNTLSAGARRQSGTIGFSQSLSRFNGLFASTARSQHQVSVTANQLTAVMVSNHSEIPVQATQPVEKKKEKEKEKMKTISIEDRLVILGITTFIDNSAHPQLNKFYCPLALGPMTDPVIADDGHHYERIEIEKQMGKPSPLNPSVTITTLIPDHDLKSEILEFVEGLERKAKADRKQEGPVVDLPSVATMKR
jgi:hypothetical protein